SVEPLQLFLVELIIGSVVQVDEVHSTLLPLIVGLGLRGLAILTALDTGFQCVGAGFRSVACRSLGAGWFRPSRCALVRDSAFSALQLRLVKQCGEPFRKLATGLWRNGLVVLNSEIERNVLKRHKLVFVEV